MRSPSHSVLQGEEEEEEGKEKEGKKKEDKGKEGKGKEAKDEWKDEKEKREESDLEEKEKKEQYEEDDRDDGSGGEDERTSVELKKKAVELDDLILENQAKIANLKASIETLTVQYESELNRRTKAEQILRDLCDQEHIIDLLNIPSEASDLSSYRPSPEEYRAFWNVMVEERRQSLEMQAITSDLQKRASRLGKEQAMYQCQKEQLHSLVVGYMRERETGTSESTMKQQLQSLYKTHLMDEKCRSIFCRPAHELPLNIDIPRLVRQIDVIDRNSNLLSEHDPDSTVPASILSLLVLLTEELDEPGVAVMLKDVYHELVPDDTSQEDLQKHLLSFFQHPKAESWAAVRVLKACNQAIIAPFVTRLKNAMDAFLPFNSARKGWCINIQVYGPGNKVTVTHKKKEVASPEAIDCFGLFEFEWKVEFVLEVDLLTIGGTYVGITENVNLGIEEAKQDFGRAFFADDLMEFKDILRTCVTQQSEEGPESLEKKIRKLKDRIRRHQVKLKEKKERMELKQKQRDLQGLKESKKASREAQRKQQKDMKKLQKTLSSNLNINQDEIRALDTLGQVGQSEDEHEQQEISASVSPSHSSPPK